MCKANRFSLVFKGHRATGPQGLRCRWGAGPRRGSPEGAGGLLLRTRIPAYVGAGMLRRSSAWRALGLGALSFSLFASPLPALYWEGVQGCYLLTDRHVSRAQDIVKKWHYPIAILDVSWIFDTDEFGVDTNESSEQDRRRAFRFLRPEVQEWLRRLGLVSGEGKRLSFPSFPHNTFINYVVYPAVRGRFED